jgi:uncharacterized membrane protein YgdD (TMEM256/DUF423 family)
MLQPFDAIAGVRDMGRLLAAAGFSGLCGVGFGAWAAHGALEVIGPEATEWVKTGAQYQLWHAAALLALVGLPAGAVRIRGFVGACFFGGALLFSGSLYLMAFSHWHGAAFVTPFGGLLMLLGWLLLLGFGLRTWRDKH